MDDKPFPKLEPITTMPADPRPVFEKLLRPLREAIRGFDGRPYDTGAQKPKSRWEISHEVDSDGRKTWAISDRDTGRREMFLEINEGQLDDLWHALGVELQEADAAREAHLLFANGGRLDQIEDALQDLEARLTKVEGA